MAASWALGSLGKVLRVVGAMMLASGVSMPSRLVWVMVSPGA